MHVNVLLHLLATSEETLLWVQGFLAPGTDVRPIAPALQEIWQDSMGRSLADFNFRTVTSKFNDLVYQYPIRIPERYSLVIRLASQLLHCMCIGYASISALSGESKQTSTCDTCVDEVEALQAC